MKEGKAKAHVGDRSTAGYQDIGKDWWQLEWLTKDCLKWKEVADES